MTMRWTGTMQWTGGRVMAFCVLGWLAYPSSAFSVPKVFVDQPVVDLGTIKEGTTAKHTFVIENRGDEPLEIKSIKASCSCTVPGGLKKEQKTIQPGESLDLPVAFRSKGRAGTQSSTVTLKTNDPREPSLVLRMRVTVDAVALISPKALFFPNARRDGVIQKPITIMPGKKNAVLEVLELKSGLKGLEVIVEEHKQPAQSKVGVLVKVKIGPDMPFGRVATVLRGRVKVGDETKDIKINVSGMVVGDIRVVPPFLARMTPFKRDTDVGVITVSANKEAKVQVKAAIPRSDVFVTEVVELETDKMYRVKVQLAEDAPGGPLASVVDIFTTSSDLPISSFPVFVNAEELVQVSPMSVYLDPNGKHGERRTVTFTANEQKPLQIEKIECTDPDIVTQIKPDPKLNHVVRMDVSLKPGAKAGDHYTVLKIRTNLPGARKVIVPVSVVQGEVKQASAE